MKKLYQVLFFLVVSQFTWSQVNFTYSTKNTDFTIESKDIYKILKSTESVNDFSKSGTPQLPIFSRNYVLPAGSVVANLSIANGSKTEIGESNLLTSSPTTLRFKW